MLLDTDRVSIEDCVNQVVTTLELLGMIDRVEPSAYTPQEEEMIRRRLTDLGYLE